LNLLKENEGKKYQNGWLYDHAPGHYPELQNSHQALLHHLRIALLVPSHKKMTE
jgi:hypothetical protein